MKKGGEGSEVGGILLVAALQAGGARQAGAVATTARRFAAGMAAGVGMLIREGQERIALGAGETLVPLLVGEQDDKQAREEQAEEDGEGNDGHGVECRAVQRWRGRRFTGGGGRTAAW